MARQPWLEVRQALRIEPFAIVIGKLADKGKDRHIGKPALFST